MPLAIDAPMRRPVYEPGPQLTATASSGMAWLSANDNASSTNVPSFTAWLGPSWSSWEKIHAPSWLTDTEHTSVLVSIFKIHDMLKLFTFVDFTPNRMAANTKLYATLG